MSDTKPLMDVEFAISQLGGNSDLLKRMLSKFSAEFSKVPDEINTLLAAGDIKAAKLKVHTTKGLSGNLGMLALYDCSKILDQQMRDANISQETIDLFSSLMQTTCDFIETIDLEAKESPSFNQTASNNNHKDVFIERLQRHEFIDDDVLHEYVDSLATDEAGKKNLVTLVEELQYEKAIDIIKSL